MKNKAPIPETHDLPSIQFETQRLNARADERLSEIPTSIEQLLDMNETSGLKGEEITHEKAPKTVEEEGEYTLYQMNMAEEGREGDEETGDDHSSGLQGGDSELTDQENIRSGLPGEEGLRLARAEFEESKRRIG